MDGRRAPGEWTPVLASLLLVAAALATVAHLLVCVSLYTPELPVSDEWEMLPLIAGSCAGATPWADLWHGFGPHKVLFPKLLLLGLARATHWSLGVESATNVALATALFAVVGVKLSRGVGRGVSRFALAGGLGVFAFSLQQWENFVWGWQITLMLSVLASVGALAVLANDPGRPLDARRVGLASACAVVASYSFASGLLTWPIGLLLILLDAPPEERVSRRRLALAWLALATVTTGVFFVGYERTLYHPAQAGALELARRSGTNFLLVLGLAIDNREGVGSLACGVAALLLAPVAALLLVRSGTTARRELHFPAALVLVSWGSALLVAYKEGFFESYGATCSRYSTLATPLWLATLALVLAVATSPSTSRRARVLASLVAAALVALCLASSVGAHRACANWHSVNRAADPATQTVDERARSLRFEGELEKWGLCSYRR